jgi:hypothetical protein
MKLFVGKDGKQLGPFDKEQVLPMVEAGMLSPTDLGWHDGIPNWIPLHHLLEISLPGTPPPVPALSDAPVVVPAVRTPAPLPAVPDSTASAMDGPPPAISLDHAGKWMITATGAGILGNFLSSLTGVLGMVVFSVMAIIYSSILHHRCWNALPERFRFTTPGKAVGFLFIPFFNFYWAFVTWPHLAEGVEEWKKSQGHTMPANLGGLAVGYASAFVAGFLAFFLPPIVTIVIDIATLILFFAFYTKVVSEINVLKSESGQ